MIKPASRQSLEYRQRGALGGAPTDPLGAIADLLAQAEGLETRVQHLKTGLQNLVLLHQGQATATPDPQAQTELNRLQQSVDDFEMELASRLLSWQHLQEPFWQALRYGGLGVIVGWLLHWLLTSA